MAEQNLGPRDFFAKEDAIADLGLIACPGAEELCKLVDSHLVRWAREVGNTDVDTFIIPSDCPRFQSGDAKGLVKASTRGDDLYIFVDPGNYSVTYQLFGYENHLSPDDHFQNLMRLIQAVAGRAHRISVIMPSLYGGRQHRRVSRESLDCAFALQQLRDVGVKNIITFDAHDPRVMNAVPTMSFDNVMPTYQVLKCLLHHVPDVSFHKDNFMIVSPDEGAMNRNMYYSSVLGCNLGMFYKRRDYSRIVNGRNPIVAHEYLGESVARCPQHLHLLHLPAVHRRSGEVRQGLQRRHHQGRSGHEPDLPQAGTAGARVVLRRRRLEVYRLLHCRHQP